MARKGTKQASAGYPELSAEAIRAGDPSALTGWVETMMARANAGDAEACRLLVAAFDAAPSLWGRYRVLRASAEGSLVDAFMEGAPEKLFTRRLLERECERLRQDLLGEQPTPLERVLVDRVVAAWLQAGLADNLHAATLRRGASLKQAEHHLRHAAWAHRQVLTATKALAQVRRLLAPAVQVTYVDKQLNVTGPAESTESAASPPTPAALPEPDGETVLDLIGTRHPEPARRRGGTA